MILLNCQYIPVLSKYQQFSLERKYNLLGMGGKLIKKYQLSNKTGTHKYVHDILKKCVYYFEQSLSQISNTHDVM